MTSAGANLVDLKCQTFDGHFGTDSNTGATSRMSGALIVESVFKDLAKTHGLGRRAEPDLLVVYGISSGGRAALRHLNKVDGYLGAAQKNVRVVGILDSAVPDAAPCLYADKPEECSGLVAAAMREHHTDNTERGRRDADRALLKAPVNAGASGTACEANGGGTRCTTDSEVLLAYTEKPIFVIGNVWDRFWLTNVLSPTGFSVTQNRLDCDFADGICKTVADLVAHVNVTMHALPMDRPGNALYLQPCFSHASSWEGPGFYDQGVQDVGMAEAVKFWLWGDSDVGHDGWMHGPAVSQTKGSLPLLWRDECKSFSCGRGCKPVDWHPNVGNPMDRWEARGEALMADPV